jgi:transposase-like protein
VDRIWFASFHTDLADTLTQQLRQQALLGVQATLPKPPCVRSRPIVTTSRDRRAASRTPSPFRCAGHYRRRVLTSCGLIPDLRVPKLRGGNAAPWQSHAPTGHTRLDQALYLYTLGLSLRDLQEALYLVFGHLLSREAVNRVTVAAQSPMQRWRERKIGDTPPILIVDGVWVQILAPTGQIWFDRSGHKRVEMRGQEQVVLAVMGVWEDGRHEILHYQAADTESTETWSAVLAELQRRGLDPTAVRMVVSDGTPACRPHYQHCPRPAATLYGA